MPALNRSWALHANVLAVFKDGEALTESQLAHAKVLATITANDRAKKIIVFKFKRKKQYKKIYGHRQPFTAVRITEIAFDGERFTAPDLPARKPKKAKAAAAEGEANPAKSAKGKSKSKTKPKAKKSTAKKAAGKGKKK